MEDVTQFSITKEHDFSYWFDMAKKAENTGDYKKALKILEKGIKISKHVDDKLWYKKFDLEHSELKETQLKSRIRRYLNRSIEEEKIYQYDKAIRYAEKTKKKLNALFKLGRKIPEVKKQLKKIDKRISDLKEKQRNDPHLINLEDDVKEKGLMQNGDNFFYDTTTNPAKLEKGPSKVYITEEMGISVDASNVAWNGGDKHKGDRPQAKILEELYNYLAESGITKIQIFCDNSLLHQVDSKETLIKLRDQGKIRTVRHADEYVLDYAWKNNGYFMVEGDKYRKEVDEHSYDKQWLINHRIEVSYIDGDFYFFPKFEVKISKNKNPLKESIVNPSVPEHKPSIPKRLPPKKPPAEIKEEVSLSTVIETTQSEWFDEDLSDSNSSVSKRISTFIDDELEGPKPVKKTREQPKEQPVIARRQFRASNQPDISANIQSEKITKGHYISLIKATKDTLESLGFDLVSNNLKSLKRIYKDVDIIAIKIRKIDEYLDIIIIFPIKICDLAGSLIVSESTLTYHPAKQPSKLSKQTITELVKPNINSITDTQDTLFDCMSEEREFFRYFKRYLKEDEFKVEKTSSNKKLFFRSDLVQYKVLIDPILVCKGEVGFLEKSLSLPYQRTSNVHIVNSSRFMELVEFLEDKHVYTEQYSDNVNTLAQHFENSAKFLDNLRLFSIPFILFGAAFLLVVIFQAYPLFPLFTGLGYGLISVYSVMAVCLYLKFCKQKAEIIEEFNTPYYRRPVKIDETGMMLINEELSPKMMRQFIYENFGKKANFEVIKELEEDAFHTQEKTRTTDFNDMLFEDEEDEFDDTVRFRSKTIKDNIASKYSSFLED